MEILNNFQTSVRRALTEIDPKWESYPGLIICGTHSPHDTEEYIEKIRFARETGLPALLLCFGYQLGAIEYARNVLGIKDATSEEFGQGNWVVKKRGELKVGLHEGESWWSFYDVDIPWEIPENWVAVGFHPEYQSMKGKPHPLLVKFLKYAKNAV